MTVFGLQRKLLDRGVYYVINLAELTRGTIMGEKYEYWMDEAKTIPRTQDAWRWDALARWLLCLEGTALLLEPWEVNSTYQMLYDEPLNTDNRPYFREEYIPSWVPTTSDEDGRDPMASKEPMILAFREDALPRAGFQYWYSRRVLFGTGSNLAAATTKEFNYLAEFRQTYLEPLEAANRKVEITVVKPISKVLGQLRVGEVMFTAMFDFMRPASERRKIWQRSGAPDPRAESTFVVPTPSAPRQSLVRKASADWTELTERLMKIAQLLATKGEAAKARDVRAGTLLARLRKGDEPLIAMLKDPTLLSPGDHEKVRVLLRDCFVALTQSASATEAIMKSEFAAIARAASEAPTDVPFTPETTRERSLALAIENFDAEALFPIEEKSALSDVILEFFKGTKDNMSAWKTRMAQAGIAMDLLGLATPFIQRGLFVPASGVVDVAWGWRALIGATYPSKQEAVLIWWHLDLARRGLTKGNDPGITPATPLLHAEKGALALALQGLTGNVAWKTASLLVTVIAGAQATAELADDSVDDAVAGLAVMMSVIGAAKDLATLDPQKCFLLRRMAESSGSSAEFTKAVKGSKALALLGPMADAVNFAKSALDFRASSRKQSALTREQKTEQAILDAMTMAVAAVGFALGVEFALASFAIFIGQNILLNRELWALVLPGVERAPGPQRFLSQLLHTVDDDEFIGELRVEASKGSAAAGTAGLVRAQLAEFDRVMGTLLTELDTPTAEDPALRSYWDIGGEAGASVLYVNFMAVDILRDYYGFDEDSAVDAVRKSNE